MRERPHRFIWAGSNRLSDHEIHELEEDFGLEDIGEDYVLTIVSKNEWEELKGKLSDCD